MSLWTRITNVGRGDRLNREIDEELASHIEDAIAQGRDPAEARRAFGSPLRTREDIRDQKLLPWLDSLRADAVFGWRRLVKHKVTSAAAILSLALAIGACTSAFRLIDALLLRPLPVAAPEQLYELARQGVDSDGKVRSYDAWAYPAFRLMRAAVKDQAELIAVSYAERTDLTYASDEEMEKAYTQCVSGWMFPSFGLRPTVGRLFTENDDVKPGGHPYAVISHDYWMRRFGGDPKIVGRTFHMGDTLFEIAGVVEAPFTGTETGTVTDVFFPTMMHPGVTHDDWTWFRTIVRVKPGVALEPLRAKLDATSRAFERERAKKIKGMSKEDVEKFIAPVVIVEPAAAGASGLQQEFRQSLIALGVLVTLVLLIACANVANLMTAQAAARAREMALRVSIGAGRFRLVQLVLVESAWLAVLAGAIGAVFAWWSAPFVVSRINPQENPARLSLPADWRVFGFALALTIAVTLLFGLIPALRASAVRPASALKGGEDPHSRRRLMHALIAVQVAFCFLVLFVAGLFAASFDRLSKRPLGFEPERLLVLSTVAASPQPPVVWEQVAERLRAAPGVESVATAGWPLLNGDSWNGFVSVNGAAPGPVLAFFLNVSPGWIDAMKMRLVEGRDFHAGETGVALVNETFARDFFGSEGSIGKSIAKGAAVYQVVGVLKDAPYRDVREPILPAAYVPFQLPTRSAAFLVRTSGANPLAMASILRAEVPRARGEFRVSNVRAQADMVRGQTIRERLLAMLALFFAGVALLLAGIGLYGVLDYTVLQRRREIGIRMAIGARPAGIARLVTTPIFAMVVVGALAGLALGRMSARYIAELLYQVTATDVSMLPLPSLVLLAVALAAALPAVIRAVRVNPVEMLRSE